MNSSDILDIIKILLAVFAAGFTYYKFFREGTHKQRIEFDIDFVDLGNKDLNRILEIGVLAENKGHVEHRFKNITVTVRGINPDSELSEIKGYEPRLSFPIKICSISIVPDNDYYFVRPKIAQRFPVVIKCPREITHIHICSKFIYQSSGDFHIAERAFQISETIKAGNEREGI